VLRYRYGSAASGLGAVEGEPIAHVECGTFPKPDPQFAQQALQAFRKFGFQLVIVATVQNATTIQPYIDSVVMVSKTEATGRNARPVASVATRTISEFTALRHEMRATAERVPAGV
jgi:uncharacterized protein YPO0396